MFDLRSLKSLLFVFRLRWIHYYFAMDSIVTIPSSTASTWSLNPYNKLIPKSGSDSDAATSTTLNCPFQMTVARYKSCIILISSGFVNRNDTPCDVQSESPKAGHQGYDRRGDPLQRSYHHRLQRIQSQYRSRIVALANRNNFLMIAIFDILSYVRFVDLIATSGKFFFAVSRLSDCHSLYSKAERFVFLVYLMENWQDFWNELLCNNSDFSRSGLTIALSLTQCN